MKETTRQHPQFQQQFENQPIHRSPYYRKNDAHGLALF